MNYLLITLLTFLFIRPGQGGEPVKMPFRYGEVLEFKIRYGVIKAGTAEMKVIGLTEWKGKPALHIQTRANSIPSFDWMYKVRDQIDAFVDPQTMFPIRFEKKLREGSYMADLKVDYFTNDSLARVHFIRYESENKIKKEKHYDVIVKPATYDILSAFYYVRTLVLEDGKSQYISTHESEKTYDLEVRQYGTETVETEAGKFRCLVIEPLIQGEGIFKKQGRLRIWVTDDHLKIPVLMKSKVIVGNITTELVNIRGINESVPARIK